MEIFGIPLAAFLGQQIRSGGGDADKLRELLAAAQQLGIADTKVAALNGAQR